MWLKCWSPAFWFWLSGLALLLDCGRDYGFRYAGIDRLSVVQFRNWAGDGLSITSVPQGSGFYTLVNFNLIWEFLVMKNFLKNGGLVVAGSLFGISAANATLNAGVATGFTSLQTDALALVDLVWPVTIAVTVAFIILSLFKKAASKAV